MYDDDDLDLDGCLNGCPDCDDGDDGEEFDCLFEDDGQPTEYEEWQDYMGGDDWDHGQYDDVGYYDE